MATSLKNQKGYIVEVQGFSPGNGTTAIENSREWRRWSSVTWS